MKIPWWVVALGLAGVYVYLQFRKSPLPSSVAQGIANIWLSLPFVGLPPAMQVLGNVALPDGTLVPLNSLKSGQIRTDNTTGNVYANVGGNIYQLSPSDTQGNYPATLVGPAPAGA